MPTPLTALYTQLFHLYHLFHLYQVSIHRSTYIYNLTKLWSPQLHISDHLHVVIKEHAHKCNPYIDPISISKRKA